MLVRTNYFDSTMIHLVISMIFYTSVFGCGPLSQGEVNAMSFTATGFTLPPQMVYSETPEVQNGITSISHSRDAAMKVINDLVMNAVTDVLQEQGRNALLPDAVIQLILQQLNVTIEYTPLECKTASKDPMNGVGPPQAMKDGCLIIEDVVIGLCTMMANACNLMPNNIGNVMPTSIMYRTIRGTLRTRNIIMANWSRQMWQSVVNRVFQKIASERFAKYFSTAVVTVNS